MTNFVKLLGYKIIFFRLAMTAFAVFLLFWIASNIYPQLGIIHSVPFETLVLGIWLTIAGLWDMIVGFASMPDAKSGASKAGGYVIISIGLISFAMAMVFFIGGHDLIYESPELLFLTVMAFGFATILWIAHSVPEALKFEHLVHALN